MPLINGMKMACEPCIRGHRSTKCNHANERLMVPVRKPGRPLSSCPHLKDHLCSCNSITAAIPRKQICQCSISSSPKNTNIATRTTPSSSMETPNSPGKPSFRIDKNYQKSHLKRKTSGVASLERLNSCQLHNHQNITNGHKISIVSSNGYYVSPFPNTIGPYSHTSPSLVSQSLSTNGVSQVGESSQYCNGNLDNGHSYTMDQNPMIGHSFSPNGANINTEQSPMSDENFAEIMDGVTRSPRKEKSCCDNRKNGYRNEKDPAIKRPTTSKSTNENGTTCPIQANCCMLKCTNQLITSSTDSLSEQKDSKIINNGCLEIPKTLNQNIVTRVGAQASFPETVDFNHQFYTYPPSQQPVFSYDTVTYGSFSNPLNVSTWRQTHDNMFSLTQGQNQATGTFPTVPVPEVRSYFKSCNCGDTCQCVGCVSHPYNDATQDYVRSAWQTISLEGTSSEAYTNGGQASHEDQSAESQQNIENKSVSNPPTPCSSNGEEQNLPENNFLFVNYSFPSEVCEGEGGDFSYECNNNCQFIGCDIKRRNPG
ncbi:putative copper fist dna binding domain-containing protein [Erysiphe neolycopersici]|uniref:Putative copper fist dna binding domain-containing protein n=1 Tax=Erysiphe neolycopersici TaxID=212602 RepID=A0A420HW21_9PEZI|nr:putative copper fist dna binding domain-containing protein [Erysiphe neolycopersici]